MSYVLGISKMLIIMIATISRIVQKVTVRLFILVHFHCWNYCYIIYIQRKH